MARASKKELEAIKNKHGVDRLWSWSRYNCYKNSSYEYFLKYIKKEKETRTSIYGVLGNLCHDIVDDLYSGKIGYEDMTNRYEDALFEVQMANLKFNRSDEDANEKIQAKYESCVDHFFKNHIPIKHEVVTEKLLIIKIGKYVFQGYFDATFKDEDGFINIIDWKTSTIYTGKKLENEKGQLMLYAEAFMQLGVPFEKIKIKWNFMKYVHITYPQKNGKSKTTYAERHMIVDKIKNNIKMWLKDLDEYADDEIEDMIDYAIEMNSLSSLPQEIQDKYIIKDCYIDIPFTEKEIEDLKSDISNTLKEIIDKESNYKILEDDMVFNEEITPDKAYYFNNLCGYNASQHKPYGRYLDSLEQFVDNEYKTKKDIVEKDDDGWMKELGLI